LLNTPTWYVESKILTQSILTELLHRQLKVRQNTSYVNNILQALREL
jgi:hypothetical protein